MEEIYKFAVQIAYKAGEALMHFFHKPHQIGYKGDINLVTEADLETEKLIKEAISSRYPQHSILAEESGLKKGQTAEVKWIVDPLDGTTNFAHGLPWFCVSIAVENQGELVIGAIYNPVLKEMFTALKGKGAFLNDQRISVSKNDKLIKSLIATGFPYDVQQRPEPIMTRFYKMILKARGIRRIGSAALDLCYVACGRFDGFWEERLKPWDTAAGALIVKEAGGKVSDFEGNPYSIYGKEILATNGFLHSNMLKVLKEAKEGAYDEKN